MMRTLLSLVLLLLTSAAFAGIWVEDSLGITFEYPRGYGKGVLRTEETARFQFFKPNREAVVQIDVLRRGKEYDLDRFIEETIDQFLTKYPDLKVAREKNVEEEIPGFDESTFLALRYIEGRHLVSNRLLFHKKGTFYFVIQAKTLRKKFGLYSQDFDTIMKTFRLDSRPKNRWRNDSLAYMDPKEQEALIQFLSVTIRPMDSYSSDVPKKEQEWLDAPEAFVVPEENSPVSKPDKPLGTNGDYQPLIPPVANPLAQ